ncbi:hypothetical protein BJ875DRAFT_11679 [Amylocarpus encephaloides]|uniref:Uncharacterized protein n=1 Tax=Amylocarpus encephaloides TaxID=45428 RepID=A0A9P8C5A6_9HELO|nr:hypothetical protein BJ875DRAFT_11679 [Amylocarpus encephaloides]
MARGTRAHPSDSPLQALEDTRRGKASRRKAQPLTKASKASASAQSVPSLAAPSATSQSDEGPESDSAVVPESRSTSPSIKPRHNTRSISRSISPSNILGNGTSIFNQAEAASVKPRSIKISKSSKTYTGIGKRPRSQMSPEIAPVEDASEIVPLSEAYSHCEPRANDADDESRPLKRVRLTNITNRSPSSTQNQLQTKLTPSIEHVDAPYDRHISSSEEEQDDENEENVSTGAVNEGETRESVDQIVEDFQSALDKSRGSDADGSILSSPGDSSTPRPLIPQKNNSQRAATSAASQNALDKSPTNPTSHLLPPTITEIVRKSLAEKPLPTDPVKRRKEIFDRFNTNIRAPNDKIRNFFASPSDRAAAAAAAAEAEDDMNESLSMSALDVPQTGKPRNIIQENAALRNDLLRESALLKKNKVQQQRQRKLQEDRKKHGENSAALHNRMIILESQLHVPGTTSFPVEKTLTRVDLIDAAHSIVQWAESDPSNPVPSPQQLLSLLEQFKARELVKPANPTANQSSSPSEATAMIHHRDEAEAHVGHVAEARQLDGDNDRLSFMMVSDIEDPFVSPTGANGETSASDIFHAMSQPSTPTNRANTHNQSRLWNTISRVTGAVSSPFKFLAGRNQTVGGPANETPGLAGVKLSRRRDISNPPRLSPTTQTRNKKTLGAPRTRKMPVPRNKRPVPHSLSWTRKNLSPRAQKEADARAELLDEKYFQEQQKKLNATRTGERMKKRNTYTARVEEGDDDDNENPNNLTLKAAGQRVGEKRKRGNTSGTFGFSYSDDGSSSSDDDSKIEKDPFMRTTKSGTIFRIHTNGRRKFATDDEGNRYRVDCWNNPYKHKMKPVTFGGPSFQRGGSAYDPSETAPRSKHESEARREFDKDYWRQLYMVQSDLREEDREKDNRVRRLSGYNWATDHRLSGGYFGDDNDYWDLMAFIEFGDERALEILAEEQGREHEHIAWQRREEAARRLANEAAAGHSTYKCPSPETNDEEEEEEEEAPSSHPQNMPPSSPRPANTVLPVETAGHADQPPTPAELALAKILRHNPKTPTPLSKVWGMGPSYQEDAKENFAHFMGFSAEIIAAVHAAPEPDEFE